MTIAKNTLANIGGALIPLAATILTVPVYLRLIGEERYGVLAVIWMLIGYFGFFDFGLGQATAQRMATLNDDDRRSNLLWTSLALTSVLGVLGGSALWLSSEWMLVHVVTIGEAGQKEALSSIPWLLLALPLLLLTSAMRGALQGRECFVAINLVSVIGDTFNQTLPLLVAWFGYTSMGYLLPAALGGRLLTLILLFIQCKKHVPLNNNPTIDFTQVKPLLNYGGWSCTLSMVGPLLVTLDRLVIGSISGAKSVAYYTIPYNLVTKLMIFPGSFAGALFPRLASLPSQESRILADQATLTLIAFMTPMVIVGMSVIQPFLIAWLGVDFAQRSAGVSELIILGVWVNSLVIPHHARLQAEAKLRRIFVIYLIQLPIYFIMLWAGLKYFGLMGAAAAWSLRVLIDTTMLLTFAGAFRTTVLYALPSMIMVLSASLVALLIDVTIMWRWLALFTLTAFSIALHRQLLIGNAKHFFSRRSKEQ
jgi:O-antigen/teichoic acid export membrane protein